MRIWLMGAALCMTACDAGFTDLRNEVPAPSGPQQTADAGVITGGDDAGVPPTEPQDGGVAMDAGAGPTLEPGVVSSGTWEGRGGYSASGSVDVVVTEAGSVEVVFSDDFRVSGVPGPFVVVSQRGRLSGGIQPGEGDLEIGPLERSRGAQTYQIPPEASDYAYVWVYCKPFGVEVARSNVEVQ